MAEINSILIKNIFYMLSYAFQVLKEENYKKVGTEEFQHMEDLLAAGGPASETRPLPGVSGTGGFSAGAVGKAGVKRHIPPSVAAETAALLPVR